MRLYLMRHAEAASVGTGRVRSDGDRPLTLRGRADVRRAAKALREREVIFDRILVSPLMRAVQTAEILASVLEHPGVVDSLPLLAHCDGWREGLEPVLEESHDAGARSVAIVGHNPDLSDITALLLGTGEGTIAVPASAVCCFELTEASIRDGGRMTWWLDPRDFRFRPSF